MALAATAIAVLHRTHIDHQDTVTVRAPGRLHLGFLDPSGSLGRRFGSIGLVVDGFDTEVEIGTALADRVTADTLEGDRQMARAGDCLAALRQHSGRHQALHLRLRRVAPAHAGFGSGTQLALAIGRAFAQWHRLPLATPELARWLGRGKRSGIGIHGFDLGGLLLDGGPSADGMPASLLSRIEMPSSWRVLVVQDPRGQGLAGTAEKAALAALQPMPAAHSAEICHQVLMRVLPGAASGDFEAFALGVSRVQQLLGGHFSPVQGGQGYASEAVGRLMAQAAEGPHPAAIGQSSWGPTGFAVLESEAHAEALQAALRADLFEPGLQMGIVVPRNRGAEVTDLRAARRAG